MNSQMLNQENEDGYTKLPKPMKLIELATKELQKLELNKQQINFDEVLKNYKERTENQFSYTMQQLQDVIFVDKNRVIALEYVYYDKSAQYNKLVDAENDNKTQNYLGTLDYQKDQYETNSMNAFSDMPKNLCESKEDYLSEKLKNQKKKLNLKDEGTDLHFSNILDQFEVQSNLKRHSKLPTRITNIEQTIKKDKKQYFSNCEDQAIESMISLWSITKSGQLEKLKEVSFTQEFPTQRSEDKRDSLRLQLSGNQSVVSLSGYNHENQKLKVLAWKTKNLKPLKLKDQLLKNINNVHQNQQNSDFEIKFVGKNKYLMLNYLNKDIKTQKQKRHWQIFELKSGTSKFLMSTHTFENNEFSSKVQKDNKGYKLMYILPKEKRTKRKAHKHDYQSESEYGTEEDDQNEEIEENEQKSEDSGEKDEQFENIRKNHNLDNQQLEQNDSDSQYEGGFSDQDENDLQNIKDELDLVFFFAGDIKQMSGAAQTNLKKDGKNKQWIWTKIKLSLKSLISDSQSAQTSYYEHVFEKARDQRFQEYEAQNKDYFEIPKQWFVAKDETYWESQIEVTANRKFKHFAFINRHKKQYLAYDNTQLHDKPFADCWLLDTVTNNFVRNQQTKDYLCLISQQPGLGAIATVFYNKDIKKQVYFKKDYMNANQDIIHQRVSNDKDPSKRFLIQSITLTQDKKEISLKTQIKTEKNIDENPHFFQTIERESISQRHNNVFPILLYNIGLRKLIIQNTLKNGKQYILELDPDEKFMCHIDFRDFSDLGFMPINLRLEACSRFVFLTYTKQKEFVINILLVDPYYSQIQFAHFKSTKRFYKSNFAVKEQDLIIKSIMYSTKMLQNDKDYDLKLIIQYPTHFKTNVLSDQKQIHFGDGSDNESEFTEDDDSQDSDENQHETEDMINQINFGQVQSTPLILDDQGYIYYVTSYDGYCNIKEINPNNDILHETIFEIKSSQCLGLNIGLMNDFKDCFFFMDDNKNINYLQRIREKRLLEETNEFHIKDGEFRNFAELDLNQHIIMSKQYLIRDSKIFYLFEKDPYVQGILDMEDLQMIPNDSGIIEEQNRVYNSGPYLIKDSQEFIIIYNKKDTNSFYQIKYALPDSHLTTLMSDHEQKCDFSTLLNQAQILLKIGNRFMLFDLSGAFIDQALFLTNSENLDKTSNNSELKLITLSENNEYFLFHDLTESCYKVFKLVWIQEIYQFELMYQLQNSKLSELIAALNMSSDVQLLQIKENVWKTKELVDCIYQKSVVRNDGTVTLHLSKWEKDSDTTVTVQIFAFEFTKDHTRYFNKQAQFQVDAINFWVKIFKKQEDELLKQINTEYSIQNQIAIELRNHVKLQFLENELKNLDKRKLMGVNFNIYNSNLLVIQCGQKFKYAFIEDQIWQNSDLYEIEFILARMNLQSDYVPERFFTTSVKNVIQVVTQDVTRDILIILSWDFNNNTEYSMFQCQNKNTKLENYVTRGINQKMNYLAGSHMLYDLELNIPSQIMQNNIQIQTGLIQQYQNQRKIWKCSWTEIHLSIDQPSYFNNPANRIFLQAWKNFGRMRHVAIEDIQKNITLLSFSKVYDGMSLFHHFSNNQEVISIIHERFVNSHSSESLTTQTKHTPLLILLPNKYGKTALDLALESSRTQVFELMIDMLSYFEKFCISKIMIKNFPFMIENADSEYIQKFFAQAIFKPNTMQTQIEVNEWPEDLDELTFPHYRSLVSEHCILETLGIGSEDFDKTFKGEVCEMVGYDNLREKVLGDFNIKSINSKRCTIQALDFDWIFEGENCAKFLKMLSKSNNAQLCFQPPIKIFIDLVWSYYQPKIIMYVFIPQLFFLLAFVFLASRIAGDYLQALKLQNNDNDNSMIDHDQKIWRCAVLSLFCVMGIIKSIKEEMQGMLSDPMFYFSDLWNILDIVIILQELLFLTALNITVFTGTVCNGWLEITRIRAYGAICCWLMWVKIFYWMRIFREKAYFITIIQQTIIDSSSFMVMLVIIICAFANFFFIIQNNTNDDDSYHYVDEYVGNQIIDSLIAMYLMGLGEFDFGGYSKGPNVGLAWLFFLFGTWICLIIFMNVLIAIMGDTYGQVAEIKEQSALLEQVNIIMDFIWLLDIKEIFKNQRYIIQVQINNNENKNDKDSTKNLFKNLGNKIDSQYSEIMKRFDNFEKRSNTEIKAQNKKFLGLKKTINQFKDDVTITSQK